MTTSTPPAGEAKRLDPFDLTDLWRRAQEQLKQPHLDTLKRLLAEHRAQRERITQLETALRPFARFNRDYWIENADIEDHTAIVGVSPDALTVGDLRRASRALAG